MAESPFNIAPARSTADIQAAARLFQEYADSLPIDLCFQDFDAEVANLPGKYSPPQGELLLAKDASGVSIGCVAVRPMTEESACEMKRLYVSPNGRGKGLGKALMEAIVVRATEMGYAEIRLDTLSSLTEAVAMYRKYGFVDIPPYHETRIEGLLFLGRTLRKERE